MDTIKNIFSLRWLMLLMAAVAISTSLTACGDNDDDDSDEPDNCTVTGLAKGLIGDWYSDDDGQGYRFTPDGTGWCGTYIESSKDFERGELFINFRVNPDEDTNEYALEVLWDDDPDWYTMAYIEFTEDKNTIRIRNRMWGRDWVTCRRR